MGPALSHTCLTLNIAGAKGGVGASTVASLLARSFAKRSLKVGLLDGSFPRLSLLPSYLAAPSTEHSLGLLKPYEDQLSLKLLEGFFPASPEGALYLPVAQEGPAYPSSAETLRVLEKLRGLFDLLVLDLSSFPLDQHLALIEGNHFTLLVCAPDPLSLTALKKQEEHLLARHFDLHRCGILLNQTLRNAGAKKDLKGWVEHIEPLGTLDFLGEDFSLELLQSKQGLPLAAERPLASLTEKLVAKFAQTGGRHPQAQAPAAAKEVSFSPEQVDALHKKLLERLRNAGLLQDAKAFSGPNPGLRLEAEKILNSLLQELDLSDRETRARLAGEILNLAFGLGPLEPLLQDGAVSEIMVNGPHQVYIEKKGKLQLSDVRFFNEQQLLTAIERILAPLGRRIDESQPYVDGRLLDGSRINAIIAPVSLSGPVLTIRKFSKKKLGIEDLIAFGSVTQEAADFLGACVKARKNVVVSGGTGSGKTTLLNVLSNFIPEGERIVTIEDSAELQLDQDHVVSLESRPANLEGKGRISIRDLVINSLRMRPDRIVVGEVRGGEALDMLQAMNTGHDGSLTTAHANTPRDVLSRLETMCLFSGLDLPLRAVREQISRAVHLVVQQSRLRGGKRAVTQVTEVQGMEGDVVVLQDIFKYDESKGALVQSPFAPSFLADLKAVGYRWPEAKG